MVASLLEKQPVDFNVEFHFEDEPVTYNIGGKPPRDIFYRNTSTFLTKLPPPIPEKCCRCQYLCDGDEAEIKCYSCAIYDPEQNAIYCKKCFEHRHPWHRSKHIFAPIETDEAIEYSMKISHRIAAANRYDREGKSVLYKLQNENRPLLQYLADDKKTDDDMRKFGRKALDLEKYINELRKDLQADIDSPRNQGKSLVMDGKEQEVLKNKRRLEKEKQRLDRQSTVNNALIKIQRLVRGNATRRIISLMMVDTVVRVWRSDIGKDFYYDRATGVSSWTPSKLIMKKHIDLLAYVQEEQSEKNNVVWTCKRQKTRRREALIEDTYTASTVINSFGRCILARRKVIERLNNIYRKIWDDEQSTYYYANILDSSSSWTKNSLYLMQEPPVFSDDLAKRANPVLNRV